MNKHIEKEYTLDGTAEALSEQLMRAIYYSTNNLHYFKQIMLAQLSGKVVLPHGLGLNPTDYHQLRKAVNDKTIIHQEIEWHKEDWAPMRERAEFCAEMFAMKADELSELTNLLCLYRDKQIPYSKQMATVIATASMTNHHLWESLGLATRSDLGELIKHNFPELHALNTDNMRWKRFFYRQLCEQGGDYICKAPSCKECRSYTECFA